MRSLLYTAASTPPYTRHHAVSVNCCGSKGMFHGFFKKINKKYKKTNVMNCMGVCCLLR